VPLDQQIKGLHDDLYDAGFSMAEDAGDGIVVSPAWEDELMVAVPARHPVLAFKQFRWKKCCAIRWCWATRQSAKATRGRSIVSCASSTGAADRAARGDLRRDDDAGFRWLGLGLAGEAHIASSREPGVVARRLAGKPPMLTTYLLRRDAEPSEMLARFIERVAFIDSADGSTLPTT
jgi:DNA-binding transcriptional LysR family regulator